MRPEKRVYYIVKVPGRDYVGNDSQVDVPRIAAGQFGTISSALYALIVTETVLA